ncbi:RNA polymerase II-associated protein [Lentinula aciculospora]|uniref:RNA polymerase II-associated protein n=1 Tax=Lentinula aciculospora TaxID=153920 RepID=A0A9W9AUS2_9AGAR|nr:RNA polymerase II-associated protein [Lentinula aciculospora]
MDIDDEFVPIGRSIDIELGSQEVITIDLDNLDSNPEDVLELLRDGQCKVWVWTKLAGEYWRRGYHEAAEQIANNAIASFKMNGNSASLSPIHSLLANIQIDHSRRAPKLILPNAREDMMTNQKSKEEYHKEAASHINAASSSASEATQSGESVVSMELAFLTRGIQQLATRHMDEALRSFEDVLAAKPSNLVALLGKGRILYMRRNYPQALQIFQQVLRYNPHCQPDPRIGIGLCFWSMNNKAKAKAAWERSLELNPSDWTAQLLLGLESVNASKDGHLEEEERTQLLFSGTKLIEKAFNANQKNASAANALCEIFVQKGAHKRALKLAERTIQFADTLTLLTEGYIRAGRVSHAEGNAIAATRYYSLATEGQPKHVLAAIGLAQMQMNNGEPGGAVNTLDNLLQAPNPQRSLEATVILASLRGSARPGISTSEMAQERTRARELFDRIIKTLEIEDGKVNGSGLSKASRTIREDMNMYLEIARLWQDENIDRTTKALQEALRLSQLSGTTEPRLLNNLGALHHLDSKLPQAQGFYEAALTESIGSENAEIISTSILYNLARVYEDQEEEEKAKDAFEKLLSRHPEYVDAKIRQAQLLHNINRNSEAHELIKESLASQSSNLNLRAFYTYFLVQTNLTKNAKDFVFTTLKDFDKHDVYSLCAAGWIHYNQARESRDTSSKGTEERRRGFQRSTEFYEKALQLDPFCAFAVQGLAIVTAEDALGALSGVSASSGEEAQRRIQNTRDALDVFAKVRESINDGSVYLNMGHCYYARDEFDRAIESYETASIRFYHGQNIPVLLCLCRSWYAKAMKDQSYPSIKTALKYAQTALHIQPNDKAIMYNIAMIQQKSAEMLFSLPPAKRTLKDLQRVIEMAQHAHKLFGALASDKSQQVPYSRDIADQRRKYGENMLRKKDDHISAQTKHEGDSQARLDVARQIRLEERQRQEALEKEKMELLRRDAEKLAQERRLAREQALEWTREARMNESDEEKEKKPKKAKKAKGDGPGSGDEGEAPKKKRRGKIKKANGEPTEEGEEPAASDEDETERPTKKRTKKRIVRDDDEEELQTGPQRKKQFKSREVLSDTDDEMEG